ncbi:hypothetical protein GCM10009558_011850 [Virgisporangium aurantiacum]
MASVDGMAEGTAGRVEDPHHGIPISASSGKPRSVGGRKYRSDTTRMASVDGIAEGTAGRVEDPHHSIAPAARVDDTSGGQPRGIPGGVD